MIDFCSLLKLETIYLFLYFDIDFLSFDIWSYFLLNERWKVIIHGVWTL